MTDVSNLVPLFVYGTLRHGGPLNYLIRDAVQLGPIPATTKGLLYANKGRSFPYLTVGDRDIHGEVSFVVNGLDLQRVAAMEVGAGYDMNVIKVTSEEFGTINALGFVLPASYAYLCGDQIWSGDWNYYTQVNPPTSMSGFTTRKIIP